MNKAISRQRSMASKNLTPSEQSDIRKAKRLPMFGPDIEITVPLLLLPAYMQLYHLEPIGYQNPQLLVKRLVEE